MLYGSIIFLAQNGEEKVIDLYDRLPRLGGGYTKEDILCIAGYDVDWDDVEEYGADINLYTKPLWA